MSTTTITTYASQPPSTTNLSIGSENSRVRINRSSDILQQLEVSEGSEDQQPPPDAFEQIPDGGYGWTVVFVLATFLFWTNGYTVTWGVFQTAILNSDIQVTTSTITFVGSLALGCLVAFGVPAVRLLASLGARKACCLAVVLMGCGPILTSFTLHNLGGLFCAAGLLVGSASCVLYTASNAVPVQWFSSKLGRANGLIKVGGGIGATVLPIVVQALIDAVGLAWAFRIAGLLMIATALPAALLIKERNQVGQASRTDWTILKDFRFLGLCLAGGAMTFALIVPPFFLPLVSQSIGLSASTGAGLTALFGGATTLGRATSGIACDKIGAFNTLAITVLTNAISMLAIWPVSSSLAPLIIFAAVNGMANGSFYVALPTAIAVLVGPGTASSAMGIGTTFWVPGYVVGTPLAGILISATGADKSNSIVPYRAAIFYAGGVALLGGLFAISTRFMINFKVMKKV